MPERFAIADINFGHKGVIMFCREDGTALRPEWGRPCPDRDMPDDEAEWRVAAMNEAMIERWNAIVGPKDKVEVLGDVLFPRSQRDLLGRLNGRKRLSGAGNHDVHALKDYLPYFEEIRGMKEFTLKGMPDLILSHAPLHPEVVKERWAANVHGHMHHRRVMKTVWCPDPDQRGSFFEGTEVIDPLYLCVSVEHTNYAPLPIEEVYERIRVQQQEEVGSYG